MAVCCGAEEAWHAALQLPGDPFHLGVGGGGGRGALGSNELRVGSPPNMGASWLNRDNKPVKVRSAIRAFRLHPSCRLAGRESFTLKLFFGLTSDDPRGPCNSEVPLQIDPPLICLDKLRDPKHTAGPCNETIRAYEEYKDAGNKRRRHCFFSVRFG